MTIRSRQRRSWPVNQSSDRITFSPLDGVPAAVRHAAILPTDLADALAQNLPPKQDIFRKENPGQER